MFFPKFKRFGIFLIITVVVMLVTVPVSRVTIAQTPSNLQEKAKLEVSKITGISTDNLTIVTEARLGDTGITRFKLIDTQNKIYGISLDSTGNQISQEVLDKAIQAIDNRGFVGKLEASLANRINQGINNPIRVVIWLKEVEPVLKNKDADRSANLNIIKSRYTKIQEPLVNLLKENKQQVIFQSSYTPVVVAAVTASFIKTIAERSDVERIYLERQGSPR